MRLNARPRKAMGLEGWCPTRCIAGMGVTWGIKGGPKCPSTVAKGAGMVAWLKDGGWGSQPTREAQARGWRKLQEWVRREQWRARGADEPVDRDIQAVDSLGRPDFERASDSRCGGKGPRSTG